jgi:hypothetical protein
MCSFWFTSFPIIITIVVIIITINWIEFTWIVLIYYYYYFIITLTF